LLSGDATPADQRTIARNPAAQGKRVALVIGNSAYRNYPPLSNTGNDARAMVTALQAIGFDVLDGKAQIDLDRQGLENAIKRFGRSIRGKQVGLFYYAGHGVQVDGKNYLIPVLANVESNTDIKYELVDVNFVLDEMNDAETPVNVIILDACRNNPFAGKKLRGVQSGLASMNAPKGTFIAYSTAPGKTASDGQGFNSPYTAALSRLMTEPAQRIEDVFIRVGVEVEKTTGGAQEPWQSGNLRGIFYLSDMPAETGAESSGSAVDKETVFWQSIMGSTNPAQFEAYLQKYPKGEYVQLAKLKIEELKNSQSSASKPGSGSASSASSDSQTGTWTDPVTGMEFVWVPGGCYKMGQTEAEKKKLLADAGKEKFEKFYADASPSHEVCLDGFWMGKTEVTRGQFKKFVEATGYQTEAEKEGWSWGLNLSSGKWEKIDGLNWRNPGFSQEDRHPVVCVSWNDAHKMLEWISQKGNGKFGLPSEAQWEYACRAGTKTMRFWGDDPNKACSLANVADQTGKKTINWTSIHECDDGYDYTSPVGSFQPNPFGLYDMLGNVWEWCEDVYIADIYGRSDKKNPIYTSGGSARVIRGGSWFSVPDYVRCAFRSRNDPAYRRFNVGFRLLRIL
jgi:formylglycine-generating enzyme required for sulfatase activity